MKDIDQCERMNEKVEKLNCTHKTSKISRERRSKRNKIEQSLLLQKVEDSRSFHSLTKPLTIRLYEKECI
jgi:hypothetical protein